MRQMNRVRISYIVSLSLVPLLIFSCSPKISRNLLSFIFDGVPSPVQDSLIHSDRSRDTVLTVNLSAMPGDSILDDSFYHYPYKENYCTSCHDENSKSEMILPEPDLCYSCHEDYSTVYTVVHGPAAGGYCTSCHHPHMSKEAKLLNRKGRPLCLYCHDNKLIARNPAHAETGNTDCTECHNPHGGTDRYMIR